MTRFAPEPSSRRSNLASRSVCAALAVALVGLLVTPPATAGPCEKSARQARKACRFDVKDDLWETRAVCAHLSAAGDRAECLAEAESDSEDNSEECAAIFEARTEFCAASGEHRYDPAFRKGMFTSTFDNRNPYWPLAVGNEWVWPSRQICSRFSQWRRKS